MLPSNMRGFDRFSVGQGTSGSRTPAAAGAASASGHFQQDAAAAGQSQPQAVTPFSFRDPETQVIDQDVSSWFFL